METLLVWCLLLIEEVTCFFGWRHCHLAAVSYSFNILIFIPFLRIPFRSIPGPFRFQFRNDSISPELGDSGMLNLAEVPAKFNSCGFRKESVGQGKDLFWMQTFPGISLFGVILSFIFAFLGL